MARPFDEPMDSTSSPDYPASIKYGDLFSNPGLPDHGLRLAKIKSSPNQGALTAARSASHRRGRSASETSPIHQVTMPPPLTKIKPLLRKMSNDQKTVDLSKSAAENGIDLGSNPSYHNRNTSNTSTATATSQQYIHPMRQTPKPYTPPLAHSFANSSESGSSNNPDSTPYAPLPSPRRRIPLHVHTASIPRNTSQTNLPGTPSSLRKQNEVPMVSTRTSFDSIFRKRSRANTNEDPVVRAAQVAILRREFDERERLKEEVRREQENKRVQKVTKKQQRRDQRRSNAASDRSQMKAAKNQWQLFVFWFKTMLLKMRKGMSSN